MDTVFPTTYFAGCVTTAAGREAVRRGRLSGPARRLAIVSAAAAPMAMLLLPLVPPPAAQGAPEHAVCERTADNEWCDEPVEPDGSWRRCQRYIRYDSAPKGGGEIEESSKQDCFTVPGPDRIPAFPADQPHYHINPGAPDTQRGGL